MQTRLQLTDLSPEDVIKLMGIKRTNASTLISIGQKYHNSDISNSGKNRASWLHFIVLVWNNSGILEQNETIFRNQYIFCTMIWINCIRNAIWNSGTEYLPSFWRISILDFIPKRRNFYHIHYLSSYTVFRNIWNVLFFIFLPIIWIFSLSRMPCLFMLCFCGIGCQYEIIGISKVWRFSIGWIKYFCKIFEFS